MLETPTCQIQIKLVFQLWLMKIISLREAVLGFYDQERAFILLSILYIPFRLMSIFSCMLTLKGYLFWVNKLFIGAV